MSNYFNNGTYRINYQDMEGSHMLKAKIFNICQLTHACDELISQWYNYHATMPVIEIKLYHPMITPKPKPYSRDIKFERSWLDETDWRSASVTKVKSVPVSNEVLSKLKKGDHIPNILLNKPTQKTSARTIIKQEVVPLIELIPSYTQNLEIYGYAVNESVRITEEQELSEINDEIKKLIQRCENISLKLQEEVRRNIKLMNENTKLKTIVMKYFNDESKQQLNSMLCEDEESKSIVAYLSKLRQIYGSVSSGDEVKHNDSSISFSESSFKAPIKKTVQEDYDDENDSPNDFESDYDDSDD